MRNLDRKNHQDALDKLTRQERQLTFRGVVSRTRRVEGRIDTQQLHPIGGRQLRITEEVRVFYSFPVDALNKFLFVPGYSKVGGGDLVPPF